MSCRSIVSASIAVAAALAGNEIRQRMTILTRSSATVSVQNVPAILETAPELVVGDIEMPHEDATGSSVGCVLTAFTRDFDRVCALTAGLQTHMGNRSTSPSSSRRSSAS